MASSYTSAMSVGCWCGLPGRKICFVSTLKPRKRPQPRGFCERRLRRFRNYRRTSMYPVNLAEKFVRIEDYWNPRLLGELNDFAVKAVKLKGEFVWHHHDIEDELFLVVRGTLRMRFRDHDAVVREGEFLIVPH